MVKQGNSIRRKGTSKVTRKARKNVQLRVANKLTNQAIKKEWDKKLSPADNLANFGLNADVNHSLGEYTMQSGRKKERKDPNAVSAAFVGMAAIPSDKDLSVNSLSEHNPKRRPMSEVDQQYAVDNILKHGDDYSKMAKDTKTNVYQHTAAKMKKMCEKYLELPGEHKLVHL